MVSLNTALLAILMTLVDVATVRFEVLSKHSPNPDTHAIATEVWNSS